MPEERRRAIAAERYNPDFSAQPSQVKINDIPLEVITELRRLLAQKRAQSGDEISLPDTRLGLLRDLGLVDEGGLNMAAEILLMPSSPVTPSIRYLTRSIIGAEPQVTEFNEPVLLALQMLRNRVMETGGREIERISFSNGREVAIPRFPGQAVDEALTNALIHRDWRSDRPVVIDQSPRLLKVHSPGPLPDGVDPQRLLTTQSVPRNARLMSAMRMLGLAEESSRGFVRMWAAMLSTGRDSPEVIVESNFVEVVLAAGQPDVDFIRSLEALSEDYGTEVIHSINVLIVLHHLWSSPFITEATAAVKTHAVSAEVRELMEHLVEINLLGPSPDESGWVLSKNARDLMGMESAEQQASVSLQEWIEDELRSGAALGSAEVSKKFGVTRNEVTDIFRQLRSQGVAQIDPEGPQRGPGTVWILKKTTPQQL